MENEIIETREVKPTTSRLWADRSESIDKLAVALSKAQAAFSPVKKDADNPFFKSKYADLAGIWEAIRKPLADNGLAILQEPAGLNGHIKLATTLVHSSGQYTRSILSMPVTKQDPQGYGSAVTYARRYALQSIVGIAAEEDDDGNAASVKPADRVPQRQQQPQQPTRQQAPAPQPQQQSISNAEMQGKYIYKFPKGMEQHDREELVKVLKAHKFRWDKANYQWYGSVEVPQCEYYRVSAPQTQTAPIDIDYEPDLSYYEDMAASFDSDEPIPF